jgi:flavin-binding protein dodecin
MRAPLAGSFRPLLAGLISTHDTVNNAISRAGKTIRNMNWFEVAEVRGQIEDNKVAHWQVTVKVGFTLDS